VPHEAALAGDASLMRNLGVSRFWREASSTAHFRTCTSCRDFAGADKFPKFV